MVGTESYPLEAFGSWMDVVDHPYVTGDFVWTAFDYIGVKQALDGEAIFKNRIFSPGTWLFVEIWTFADGNGLNLIIAMHCGKKIKYQIWVTPPQPSFALNPERQSWSKWHWIDAVNDWNWKGNEGKIIKVNIYSSWRRG